MDQPPPSGAKVRVTQVTDIDEPYDSSSRVITDPDHEFAQDWQDPPQSFIGQVATVVESAICDYYDCLIQFPWQQGADNCAFKYDDLELVEE